MEYLSLGSLDKVLNERGKSLKVYDLVSMAAGAASGMEYLASNQIIHRDLGKIFYDCSHWHVS